MSGKLGGSLRGGADRQKGKGKEAYPWILQIDGNGVRAEESKRSDDASVAKVPNRGTRPPLFTKTFLLLPAQTVQLSLPPWPYRRSFHGILASYRELVWNNGLYPVYLRYHTVVTTGQRNAAAHAAQALGRKAEQNLRRGGVV